MYLNPTPLQKKKKKRNTINAEKWNKLADLDTFRIKYSRVHTGIVRYKIVGFFLPLIKQNNIHNNSCNSSSQFVEVDARKLILYFRDLSSRVFGLAS